MQKLSDGQRAALLNAARRDDGVANLAEILKGAAAARVGTALIARKLMREVKTKAGMPVWRRDGEGRAFSLVISTAGRKAVGAINQATEALGRANSKSDLSGSATSENAVVDSGKGSSRRKTSAPRASQQIQASSPTPNQRAGTKKALLVELLTNRDGTSIDALVCATGWLPHTTRAALTGLRHAGHCIERTKLENGGSLYRLIRAPAVPDGGSVTMKGNGAAAARG